MTGRPHMDVQALSENLKRWRWREAMANGVPPHLVVPNVVLDGILRLQPASLKELELVPGLSRADLDRHGPTLVGLVLEASELRGSAPLPDAGADDATAGHREALKAVLTDIWGAIASSAAWSMSTEEPIPTASGKSLLYVDAVTPSAISYRAGKGSPQALTRRDVVAAAKRILLGGGRNHTLEELAMENSSHIVVFLALTRYFETGYDRRVTIRARLDHLGEEAKAAIVAFADGPANGGPALAP